MSATVPVWILATIVWLCAVVGGWVHEERSGGGCFGCGDGMGCAVVVGATFAYLMFWVMVLAWRVLYG